MVVETKSLVHVILFLFNDRLLPWVLVKSPDPKITVVKISKSEQSLVVLNHLLHLYIIFLSTSTEHLGECHLLRLEVKHSDIVLSVILLCHKNGGGGVVRQFYVLDHELRLHMGGFEQVFENFLIILELWVSWDNSWVSQRVQESYLSALMDVFGRILV